MDFFHALPGNVSIDLSRRDVAVAEQQLNHTKIGTVVQEVRCKRVAHGMRRELFLTPAFFA